MYIVRSTLFPLQFAIFSLVYTRLFNYPMPYTHIGYETADRIAWLTLNRPEKRNALNETMIGELTGALQAAADDPAVKVVVLKATGKVFSAGADLEYLERLGQNSYEENLADSRHLMGLFLQIYQHEKLIIAQVEGHAIAGGCGLASVCDLCYAVPEAKFGYTEAQIGFIPALVSVFLVPKIGEGRARELLLTGRLVDAGEASAIGLITAVAEKASIRDVVREKALSLCTLVSAASTTQTKQLLCDLHGLGMTEGLELAAERNARARATEDCREGIRAFLEKRKKTW
jgi:methylglutaconyl-CoA hydratase